LTHSGEGEFFEPMERYKNQAITEGGLCGCWNSKRFQEQV